MIKITRDLIAERRAALDFVGEKDESGSSPDARARQNLERWFDKGSKPEEIFFRRGFIRRLHPLTTSELAGVRISDRKAPALAGDPPLARLVPIPKGVALRTALTLLFLAQTHPDGIGRRGSSRVGTRRGDRPRDMSLGLVDLVATHAKHRAVASHIAGDVETNRERQLVSALKRLSENDVRLVGLNASVPPRERFARFSLNREDHNDAGPAVPYTIPDPADDDVVAVPAEFFLNGWIHTLTNREIALWLMLRAEQSSVPPKVVDEFPLSISGRRRITDYNLSLTVYETNSTLAEYELIAVKPDPNRRPDGTIAHGDPRERHSFKLTDDGLQELALPIVSQVWQPNQP